MASRAWENSKILPIEVFKDEPYLKTSGIAVLLASVLEADGNREKAYDIYLESLEQLQQAGMKQELSGPETLRAIALSYKLGEMAAKLDRREDEERYLVWAVEAILKSIFRLGDQSESSEEADHTNDALEAARSQPRDPDTRTMLSELSLPTWATKTDIASPLEALGTFYAEAGRVESVYLHKIDACAQLMANLSELIIRNQSKPTEEVLHQAEAWALKGLQITMKAKEKLPHVNSTCELAFAVALFNVAALRRIAGDNQEAKKLFALSLKQSKSIGLQTGIEHAEQALRELGDSVDPPPEV
ncbi:hypothetical protein C0993_001426 [Termitomyces sp. T159_Od127]|nr:hypothetical protein C0993_001426 [Termitomyces sp. T159_Od127]